MLLDEPLTLYRVVTVDLGAQGQKGASVRMLAGRDVRLELGKQVWLKLNPSKFHYFDRDSGTLLV